MTVDEALATVDLWHECELDCCDDSPACALAVEVRELRKENRALKTEILDRLAPAIRRPR